MSTRKEDITPQVDGVTDTFTTTKPYQPGTLMIGYNGQVYPVNFNIAAELPPLSFQLDFIPSTDTHSLHVIYEEREPMRASGRPPHMC